MKHKPLLRPDRLRHVPRQFSWIDQRFIRDRHITRCRSGSIALYLFLVTVADDQGLSYYSDAKTAGLLSLDQAQLRTARQELLEAGLIAYEAPFYQILSLEPCTASLAPALVNSAAEPICDQQAERSLQTLSMADALRLMLDQKRPVDMFELEKPYLRSLPMSPPDLGVARTARVTNRCRVHVDANKYWVPALFSSQLVDLQIHADRICIYHNHKLIATHRRRYERNLDIEDPDHLKELVEQRKNAREQQLLLRFHNLTPKAELFHHQLLAKTFNAREHIRRILALADTYGREEIARLIEDAVELHACTSQYIVNLLEQRRRFRQLNEPGPLHLTRSSDLLDIELKPADLSVYQ